MAKLDKKSDRGLNIDKMVAFCKSNIKYISAGVVTVALVVFLAVTAANNGDKKNAAEDKTVSEQENADKDTIQDGKKEESGDSKAAEQVADEHPEITELISTYYNSYAAGDLDKLSGIAKKLSDMEKDYIKMMNEHVESYGNVSCTVTDGAEEGTYIVSAVYEMKFAGVDETLPGMNVFYVQTDKKGELYINNRYSSFNRELQERKPKKEIIALMEAFEQSADIQKLQQEVQTEYDQKVADNEDLQKKLNEVADAIANWKESYTPPEEEDTQPEEEQQPEEPEATEEEQQPEESEATEEEQQPEEPEATDDGNTDDGSEDDGNSSGLNYVPEGTVLTANDGYNVRKSMDETSELVGTTAVGDSITIVLSYAEGWTKVEWNGNTGYIRTDLLLNN